MSRESKNKPTGGCLLLGNINQKTLSCFGQNNDFEFFVTILLTNASLHGILKIPIIFTHDKKEVSLNVAELLRQK